MKFVIKFFFACLAVVVTLICISAFQYNPPQVAATQFWSGPTLPTQCTGPEVFSVVSGGTITPYYNSTSGICTWTAFGGSATFTALSKDAVSTSTGGVTTVVGLNGTLLSGLASGLLFNTTSTGVPSIATGAQVLTSFGNESANTVLAGPASGSAATPAFRALTGADLPACNDWQNVGAGVASSLAMPSNVNSVASFTAPCTGTFTKITYFVNTADASANAYDFGWYSFSGTTITQICHVGATVGTVAAPTSSAFVTLTMLSSGCTFTAGTRYYLGWTGNAITFKYGCGAAVPVLDREGSNGVSSGGVLATPLTVTGGSTNWNQVTCVPWVDMHN